MNPETVMNAIVGALSAGALTGASDTAKEALSKAYKGLISLAKKRFGEDCEIAKAVEELEAKPDSLGRRQVLSEELDSAKADYDPELASAAESLLQLVRSLPQSKTHIQSAIGNGIAQADRGGTAKVMFPRSKDNG